MNRHAWLARVQHDGPGRQGKGGKPKGPRKGDTMSSTGVEKKKGIRAA